MAETNMTTGASKTARRIESIRTMLRTQFNRDGNDLMTDVCGNTVRKRDALDRFQPFGVRLRTAIFGQ